MAKIPLNLAQPGMVLSKPVTRGDSGMVLVGEGTELTEGVLNTLERMGIKSITVHGEVPGASGISSQERIDRLDHLFRTHAEDPWMDQVKSFLRDYFRTRTMAGGGASDEADAKEER